MTKKSAKKRRPQIPKIKKEISEDLYMFRKGAAKRKKAARRMKKIMKHIVIKEINKEEQEEDEGIQTVQEEEERNVESTHNKPITSDTSEPVAESGTS